MAVFWIQDVWSLVFEQSYLLYSFQKSYVFGGPKFSFLRDYLEIFLDLFPQYEIKIFLCLSIEHQLLNIFPFSLVACITMAMCIIFR
jgi:hypothetical protein